MFGQMNTITLIDSSNVRYKFKYPSQSGSHQSLNEITYSNNSEQNTGPLEQLQVEAKIKLAFKIKKCTTFYLNPSKPNSKSKEYTVVLGESEKGKLKIWSKEKQIVELSKIIDYVKIGEDSIYILKEEDELGDGSPIFSAWKLILLTEPEDEVD